jgi:predicted MFS family arabinose efflux permease
MGIAPILAPMLTKWAGIAGDAPLYLGAAITFAALFPLLIARFVPVVNTDSTDVSVHVLAVKRKSVLSLGVAIGVIGGITEASFSGLFPIFGAGRNLGANEMATLLSIFGLGGLLLQYLAGWLADHRGLNFATLVCAASTVLFAAIASFPLGFFGLAITIFALGGTITAYLTLSIIAATTAGEGDLSVSIRQVSMAYTASSILGPILAGITMNSLTSDALIWLVGLLAIILCAYLLLENRVVQE